MVSALDAGASRPGSSPCRGHCVVGSWARHTVPLSTQVYKWPGTGKFNARGNPAMDKHPIQGGVEIFPVASCYRNRDKLRLDGPLGPNADFTYLTFMTGRKTFAL